MKTYKIYKKINWIKAEGKNTEDKSGGFISMYGKTNTILYSKNK